MKATVCRAAVLCWLGLVITNGLAQGMRPDVLKSLSSNALIDCLADQTCGQSYWAVSIELARRRPIPLLISSYGKSTNSLQRTGILLALHGIDSEEVAHFMRAAIDSKRLTDDDLYYANDYLGERCDPEALRFLSGSGTREHFQLAACSDWARTVSYFGKCRYVSAAKFLVNALQNQCLDVDAAAVQSLSALFPDHPKQFASQKAMVAYYSKRSEGQD
jgi:hypothetical protein